MTIVCYGNIRLFLSFRSDSGEISRYVSIVEANYFKDSSASLLNDKKTRYLHQHFLSLEAFWRYDRFFNPIFALIIKQRRQYSERCLHSKRSIDQILFTSILCKPLICLLPVLKSLVEMNNILSVASF
jgi:hypothetical protein